MISFIEDKEEREARMREIEEELQLIRERAFEEWRTGTLDRTKYSFRVQ